MTKFFLLPFYLHDIDKKDKKVIVIYVEKFIKKIWLVDYLTNRFVKLWFIIQPLKKCWFRTFCCCIFSISVNPDVRCSFNMGTVYVRCVLLILFLKMIQNQPISWFPQYSAYNESSVHVYHCLYIVPQSFYHFLLNQCKYKEHIDMLILKMW